jgi:hypothetical protein
MLEHVLTAIWRLVFGFRRVAATPKLLGFGAGTSSNDAVTFE